MVVTSCMHKFQSQNPLASLSKIKKKKIHKINNFNKRNIQITQNLCSSILRLQHKHENCAEAITGPMTLSHILSVIHQNVLALT